MEPGETVFWALTGASFATSFITAAFGIGGGAVLLAILASLLPPAALIPVHGLVQLGSNAGRAAIMWRHLDRSVLGPFVVGTAIGIAAGGAIAVQLPPPVVQIGVGCFILWTVALPPPAILRRSAAAAGVFSSFLSMFFGGTGPFVAAFIRTLDHDRLTHLSTHSTFMTVQHSAKTVAFGFLGFAFGPWLALILAMVASGFAGTVAGRLVLTRIDEALFRRVLRWILVILALRLIWAGGRDWFG